MFSFCQPRKDIDNISSMPIYICQTKDDITNYGYEYMIMRVSMIWVRTRVRDKMGDNY